MYCGERTMELQSTVLNARATTDYRTANGHLELYAGRRLRAASRAGGARGEVPPAPRFANRARLVACEQ